MGMSEPTRFQFPTKRVALALLLVLIPACLARVVRRGPGEDCSAVTALFRETNGGVGPEFVQLEGQSGYVACPTSASVPAPLKQSWTNANQNVFVFQSAAVAKIPDAQPIHASVERSWTHPEDGVLYRYAEYMLVFNSCDFWYSPAANTKCAPTTVAPAPSASASAP
jgi:hypothetical protein